MRTIKTGGGQMETRHFVNTGLRMYRSLYELMRDQKQYAKIRAELNLPKVVLQDNGTIVIKTYGIESWCGTITRNYYFVFDQYGRLIPNFASDEVAVDPTNVILCLVFDPPYNVDNVNVEFCAKMDSIYIQPLTRDGSDQYKLRDTASFYPGRGIPSEFELAEMVREKLQLSESHEFQDLKSLKRSRYY